MNSPAVTNYAALIRQLHPQQQRRLASRLTPLSFSQEQMWFLHRLNPADTTYNLQYIVRARGPLAADALRQALGFICRRHALLRTTYANIEDEGYQIVHDVLEPAWAMADFTALPELEREAAALGQVAALLNTPFDLEREGPLRMTVLRLSDQEHLVATVVHHIAMDATSVQLFLHELSQGYAACLAGTPPAVAALDLQYADFAAWQRKSAQEARFARELSYWRERLQGMAPALDLPTDHSRSNASSSVPARLEKALPVELAVNLAELARREHVTPYMVMLGGLAILLWRYTGQNDLCIGSPVSGRLRPELRGLIGNFVNTVAMRLVLSARMTLRELLAHVREVVSGAFAHQSVPLPRVLEEVRTGEPAHRTQLFQVMLNMVSVTSSPPVARAASFALEPVTSVEPPGVMTDLGVVIYSLAAGMTVNFDFNARLFERDSIERLAGHYETLLAAMCVTAEAPLASLSLLQPAQREWLLEVSRGQPNPFPNCCVHDLFAAQVSRTPEAIAVVYRGRRWSYRELDQRSNFLARELQRRGVAPERFLFTLLNETDEVVLAWLAVMKTGGAFIPLDTAAPVARNQVLLDSLPDCGLISRRDLAGALSLRAGRCLEIEAFQGGAEHFERPRCRAANPLYAMFTSGSTGVPKGVVITHAGIVNRLYWMDQQFDARAWARVMKTTRHNFDSAIWQVFWPLVHGGSTVIIDAALSEGVRQAFQSLQEEYVTAVDFVPSAFSAMREELGRCGAQFDRLDSLRLVIFGGEEIRNDGIEWFSRRTRAPIFNLYGPTEASIGCIFHPVNATSERKIPIGRPIANTRILIMTADLSLAPAGVPGEICIAGACLARGYLEQPRLTAEAFVPDPFGSGERLYRTGDLGRWTPQGSLEFLGRIDQQVKIRGFRIEPGEVEAMLLTHASIAHAAVVTREDEPGRKHLVAYGVAGPGRLLDPKEVRSFLRQRLPDYMVPTMVIALDALPRMPNGKLDRKALPAPVMSESVRELDRPRTAVEETLARIWAEVLKLEQVGPGDNYFDLGGDSILSLKIVARAEQAGLRITVRQIFEQQTLGELACVARRCGPQFSDAPKNDAPFALLPIQQRFLEAEPPDPNHFSQAMRLSCRRPLSIAFLRVLLPQLLQHHDALRLRFVRRESGWVQYYSPDAHMDCEHIDLAPLDPARQEAAIQDALGRLRAQVNILQGPLVQAALLELGSAAQVLLVVIHHLAVDGVSWRVLLDDLQTGYTQLESAQPVNFGRKTTSLKSWCQHLVSWAQSPAVKQENAYWQSVVATYYTPLKPDREGTNTIASARVVSASLDPTQTQSLLEEVPAVYHTRINEALLAALVQMLIEYTGGPVQLIDLEGHGRESVFETELDLSRTVGWFTTLFPVRFEVDPAASPTEALLWIKEQLRSVPSQGQGFGALRYVHRTALAGELEPQISFNYLGRLDHENPQASLFQRVRSGGGSAVAVAGHRKHLIDINTLVLDGRLQAHWTYSSAQFHESTIAALAGGFITHLRRLIAQCLASEGAVSTSDFPLLTIE